MEGNAKRKPKKQGSSFDSNVIPPGVVSSLDSNSKTRRRSDGSVISPPLLIYLFDREEGLPAEGAVGLKLAFFLPVVVVVSRVAVCLSFTPSDWIELSVFFFLSLSSHGSGFG